MKLPGFLLAASCLIPTLGHAAPATDSLGTRNGPILFTALFHASTEVDFGGKVILVDPISAASLTRKADVILITHSHPDHLDPAAIAKVSKNGTKIVGPAAVTSTLKTPDGATVITLANGQATKVSGFDIRPVPAYNLVRGPKPGQYFHPRGEFDGYVLTLGGKRVLFAGDTEATPELKALKKIDVAFLPMNLPYTMTPAEAAKLAKAFRPRAVYPYHYRYPFNQANTNPKQFAALLKGSGIKVKFLEFYPPAAVAKALAATGK